MEQVNVVRRVRTDTRHDHSLGDRSVAGELHVQHVLSHGHHQPLGDRRKCNQEPDGADDPGVRRCLAQTTKEEPIQDQSEQRGENQHGNDQRRRNRHASGVKLVVEVGDSEGDGAVGEVEDS